MALNSMCLQAVNKSEVVAARDVNIIDEAMIVPFWKRWSGSPDAGCFKPIRVADKEQ